MGELVDRDQEHLNLLKMGFYLMAGLTGFCTLFSLIYIAMGGLFALGVAPPSGMGVDQRYVGLIILGIGVAFLVFGLAITLLTYFAGRSLGERRHRIYCMVVAGLMCLSIPFGTVLGVCVIIVLNRPGVEGLFDLQNVPPVFPPSTVG